MAQVVFLKKSKESYKWFYLVDTTHYVITSSGNMLEQLVDVITRIRAEHKLQDERFTIFSTAFLKTVFDDLRLSFPNINLVAVTEPDLAKLFNKIMRAEPLPAQKKKGKTLFICSDASKSPHVDICGWAWFSSDKTGATNFNFGVGKQYSIVTAEFEGILHAIIDNGDKDYSTLHIYCDSLRSVEHVQAIARKKFIPALAAEDRRLIRLIDEAYEIMQVKNVRVEWVRGHKNHRLNMGADYLSRKARIASEQRAKLAKSDPEVQVIMERLFV
jgi:ribonuclease HI